MLFFVLLFSYGMEYTDKAMTKGISLARGRIEFSDKSGFLNKAIIESFLLYFFWESNQWGDDLK